MALSVELVVLGSGTAIPRPDRAPSGYWLRVGGEHLLVDSGPGTLTRLTAAGCPLESISRVFYTHFHPDHTLDLPAILFALTNPSFAGSVPRLEIYGPPGLEALLQRMRSVYGAWLSAPRTEVVIKEIRPGGDPVDLPACRVRVEKMLHTPESQGYRFETRDGPVVALSGDTDVCPGAVALGRGADLLVLECSFAEKDHAAGHLTPARAGRIARDAGAKSLLLTHFYPSADAVDAAAECRREYSGPVTLATDGLRLRP